VQAALAAASAADVLVLAMGIDQAIEGESHDRTDIDLPANQHELIGQLAALGKPIVLLLFNGGMVAVEAEKADDNVGAIVECFYPGFQGAAAISSVLFGDYNPGGKMPFTVYPKDYINEVNMTDMDFTTPPGRSYRFYDGPATYEFGYGLSYTSFALKWSNASMSQPQRQRTGMGWSAKYSCVVTNTGAVDGDEVVLLFLKPKQLGAPTPLKKQLVGYQRVHVAKGASATVTFDDIDAKSIAMVSTAGDRVSMAGEFELEATNGHDQSITSHILLAGGDVTLSAFDMAE